jgi:hypothetical protein
MSEDQGVNRQSSSRHKTRAPEPKTLCPGIASRRAITNGLK